VLAAVLRGENRPEDNSERLDFARLRAERQLHASAARLYTESFAADPNLANDAGAGHRDLAACSAARAGCGLGKDDPPTDAAARARPFARAATGSGPILPR
jgi:hypothetical protein